MPLRPHRHLHFTNARDDPIAHHWDLVMHACIVYKLKCKDQTGTVDEIDLQYLLRKMMRISVCIRNWVSFICSKQWHTSLVIKEQQCWSKSHSSPRKSTKPPASASLLMGQWIESFNQRETLRRSRKTGKQICHVYCLLAGYRCFIALPMQSGEG